MSAQAGCLVRGGPAPGGGVPGGLLWQIVAYATMPSHPLLQGVPGLGGVAEPPPPVMATAAGGTHPTGMHC